MPEPPGVAPSRRRPARRRPARDRRRLLVTGGVAVAVSVILAGVIAANRTTATPYRTATVERGDVDAALDAPGTIQSVNAANLGFPVAGTVSTVPVTVGQHVTVGQTLAQLDTTALDAQVASAQSTVAAAQARLATDGQSQTSGTAPTGVAPAAFVQPLADARPTPMAQADPSDPLSATRQLVTDLQIRLLADQHRADQDLAQEQRDIKTETGVCNAFVTSAGGGKTADTAQPRSDQHSSTPPSPTPAAQPTGPAVPPPSDAAACESALTKVLADQIAVSQDQHAVAADLPALDAAIDKLMALVPASSNVQQPQAGHQQGEGATGSPAGGPNGAGTGATSPAGANRPGTGATSPAGANRASGASRSGAATSSAGGAGRTGSTGRPASAEQLAADQAAIDAAAAQLADAQQAHDQATLVSPISGTVASVTIAPGQSVQGGSSPPQIIVIGPGAQEVTAALSDITISSVRVGDTATVTPSGGTTPLHGQVVSVGLLPTSGSTSTSAAVSYPITIGLTTPGQPLFDGQSAAVSITLAHVSDTLTVPSSAVRTVGANHTVTVLRGGSTTRVDITLGTVGPTRTQVLSGLNPGDQVVLADLSQPLPTTDVGNVRRAVGGGGGRPGG